MKRLYLCAMLLLVCILALSGFMQAGTISGKLWIDTNRNGQWDSGEPGVPDASVELFDNKGVSKGIANTDELGQYTISPVANGSFTVNFTIPPDKIGDYEFFASPAGTNETINSDVDATGNTKNITISNGHPEQVNIDAGIRLKVAPVGTISGHVWDDLDKDGIREPGDGEFGIIGQNVTLQKPGNDNITIKTGADGYYIFENVPAGSNYKIQFTLKEIDYEYSPKDNPLATSEEFDSDAKNNGQTDDFDINGGQNKIFVDAGMYQKVVNGTISGLLWHDMDNDGVREPGNGESGINGIHVILKMPGNKEINAWSDENGLYTIPDVPPGKNYHLEFLQQSGYLIYSSIENNTDAGEEFDSDVDGTGKTADFEISSGENKTFVDAGMLNYASLEGFIWNDLNSNGTQDSDEEGVQKNLTITIYKCGTTTDPIYTWNIGTGTFSMSDLLPGSYYLVFSVPAGDVLTSLPFNTTLNQSGITDCITLKSGDNVNAYAGLHLAPTYGEIGGLVWNDENKDGYWDSDKENGIEGVEVVLQKTNMPDVKTKTDVNGNFKFENILTGNYYTLKFGLKNGYQFSPMVEPVDGKLSSYVNPSGESTIPLIVSEGAITFYHAGMYPDEVFMTVSGHVWDDINKNGIRDEGESGIVDQDVTLQMPGKTDLTVKTGADGYYIFENAPAGNNYKIQFTLKTDYEYSPKDNTSTSEEFDSDAKSNGQTDNFDIVAGQNKTFVDAGMYAKVPNNNPNPQINGILWVDANGDGFQGGVATEPGLGGWIVNLLGDDQKTIIKSTTTSTSTDPGQTGRYYFYGLTVGATYYIQFVNPGDYTFTLQYAANPNRDSDADPATGITGTVYIDKASAKIEHIDAGVYKSNEPPSGNAKVSGRLWDDTYVKDGLQGGVSNEPGIGGQLVELYLSDGTLYKSMNTKSTGGAGDIGTYRFENVGIGGYYVKFNIPSGYSFTLKNAGNDQKDSHADRITGQTDNFTVSNNAEITHLDAGAIMGETGTGSIGDYVWLDVNANGEQDGFEPGVASVTVVLYRWDGTDFAYKGTTTTNGSGYYLFSDLIPGTYKVHFNAPSDFKFTVRNGAITVTNNSDADPAPGADYGYTVSFLLDPSSQSAKNITCVDAGLISIHRGSIGDLVWYDKDCDGIQGLAEKGVGYVEVKLYRYDDGHSFFLKETRTDEYGRYVFSKLEAGTYRLRFILPGDFEKFTIEDVDENHNDAKDSDADQNGWTDPVTLAQGENHNDVDAGLCKVVCENGSIGDLVWNDCNRNGIQDAGENGIECVEVKLHACTSDHTNANNPCGCGNLIATTKTDKTGKYLFSHLKAGYYCIEIVVPCNYTITKPDQTDDWKDSDVIPSMKHTACIKLNPCETNMTVDAGLYPTPPATIGDFVWIDGNKNGVQDQGEKGLCNVNVELYMCGVNKPVAATKTDSDGKYIFKNVTSNTSYAVKFYVPKGYAFTALDQGSNDKFDSDVCPNSAMTRFYDVLPDEVNMTIDCGMYLATTTACNYVWKDNNNNGLKDEGEPGIQGVTVELYQCSNSTLIQSVKTDAAGLFTFRDIPVESYYLQIIVPDGFKMGNAVQNGGSQDVNAEFGINGQSTCFDVAEGTTSIGKPVALVLSTTGVTRGSEIPTEFTLQQNYPNPFNPSTTIEFAVPSAGQYALRVFNMLGQEVATLLDRELPIGYHMVTFDASRMPSGMYIYRLSGSNVIMTKKMMLSK
ncbi:MAG TPA: SdrD B-like domain-containing protein [Ignavibacteriales bacterium]|nr:SdrD B-like domain-containing protein [Ignavibacteriales bacterium]